MCEEIKPQLNNKTEKSKSYIVSYPCNIASGIWECCRKQHTGVSSYSQGQTKRKKGVNGVKWTGFPVVQLSRCHIKIGMVPSFRLTQVIRATSIQFDLNLIGYCRFCFNYLPCCCWIIFFELTVSLWTVVNGTGRSTQRQQLCWWKRLVLKQEKVLVRFQMFGRKV